MPPGRKTFGYHDTKTTHDELAEFEPIPWNLEATCMPIILQRQCVCLPLSPLHPSIAEGASKRRWELGRSVRRGHA